MGARPKSVTIFLPHSQMVLCIESQSEGYRPYGLVDIVSLIGKNLQFSLLKYKEVVRWVGVT
jgi:hypothetical protein